MPQRFGLGVTLALLLAITVMPAMAQAPGSAPTAPAAPAPTTPAPAGPIYVMTFFEVVVPSAGKAASLLHQYAVATRKAEGNTGMLALREIARPERFAMVEVWRDKAALDAHAAAMASLSEKLQPIFTAPFDTRRNAGLAVAGPPLGAEAGAGHAVYVLTHVDVFPAGKDQTVDMLKQLAEESRKDDGYRRLDVLQQEGRLNHLPVIEMWRDQHARSDHAAEEHTRAFRAKLVTLQGALYDERLYQAL
jgi:quinol monooxygenase YgiN